MHTEMIKIFEIRGSLLKRCNPKFYKAYEQIIKQSSLAAQDFYFSGDLAEYENCSTNELSHDSFYASLHAAYNIPYNTHDSRCVNCGLVIDLANALREDIKSGILDATGGLQNPTRLQESHILQTYHNSPESGTPIEAFARMSKNARETFIRLYHKQKQQ